MKNEILYRDAVIEIGSNSIKTSAINLINKNYHFDCEYIKTGRLGQGLLLHKKFLQKVIDKNICIIKELFCKLENVNNIYIIATEAMRQSLNADILCTNIYNETGVKVKILNSDEEAYFASKSINNTSDKLIIDIGGASTEIISHKKTKVLMNSYPVGAVSIMDLIKNDISGYPDYLCFLKETEKILEEFFPDKSLLELRNSQDITMYGIGGTFTSIVMLKNKTESYIPEQINMQSFSLSDLQEILINLHQYNVNDRKNIKGMIRDRADILPFGMAILYFLMKKLSINSVYVSIYGVRHGFLIEQIKEKLI